jgi:hypothetical protein
MTRQLIRLCIVAIILGTIVGTIGALAAHTRVTGNAHFDISFNEDAERNILAIDAPPVVRPLPPHSTEMMRRLRAPVE